MRAANLVGRGGGSGGAVQKWERGTAVGGGRAAHARGGGWVASGRSEPAVSPQPPILEHACLAFFPMQLTSSRRWSLITPVTSWPQGTRAAAWCSSSG